MIMFWCAKMLSHLKTRSVSRMVYPPDLGHIVTTGHKGICKPLSTGQGQDRDHLRHCGEELNHMDHGLRTTQGPSQL